MLPQHFDLINQMPQAVPDNSFAMTYVMKLAVKKLQLAYTRGK